MKLDLGVSYFGNRIPWHVREDLKAIRDIGCTYVVHTFSEEDLEFYQGAMAEIVKATHDLGMKAWLDPWGVGQAFGGETFSHLIAKNLKLRQVDSRGESLPIACLNHPTFREYLLHWIDVAVSLGADVLFWDEPHFMVYPEQEGEGAQPKLWACCCLVCEGKYKAITGKQLPDLLTSEVRAFKEASIVETTQFLCDATDAKKVQAAVCLLPFENSSTVSDWAKVAQIPSLDILGTDPYWRPHQKDVDSFVGRLADRIVQLSSQYGKEGQLWILNFNIPKGEEPFIQTALERGWKAGIRNFAAWSYFGASYMKIRAEDPETVWKTLKNGYQDLKSRV